MRIFSDIDDCITNFNDILLKHNNIIHNTLYTKSDITYWHWWNRVFPNAFAPLSNPSFWDEIVINPKAVSVLESMVTTGNEVYLASASSFIPTLSHKIKNTISAFNPNLINERNIIICYDKYVLSGDVLIDDRSTNIERFTGEAILFDQPWNQHCQRQCYRAYDWGGVETWLNVLENVKK